MGRKSAQNLDDTEKIALEILKELEQKKNHKGATIVGLRGNLGAGKTAFTKTIARHLGIRNKVNSPTFVIMKKYSIAKNPHFKYLFHLDAYRLKNEHELYYLGWEEILASPEHLVFIEWPENVPGAMPEDAKFIHISHGEGESREFEIEL